MAETSFEILNVNTDFWPQVCALSNETPGSTISQALMDVSLVCLLYR
jgi:hypothetical protein